MPKRVFFLPVVVVTLLVSCGLGKTEGVAVSDVSMNELLGRECQPTRKIRYSYAFDDETFLNVEYRYRGRWRKALTMAFRTKPSQPYSITIEDCEYEFYTE